MLIAKWFSFPVTLLYVVNSTDITNYNYYEAKSLIPACSYVSVLVNDIFAVLFILNFPPEEKLS